MDDLEKDQELPQEQNEEQQGSPFDQAGRVTQDIQKVGKKAAGALRGVGAASEAAEATGASTGLGAGAGVAGAEGATAGALAGETAAQAGALAAASATEAAAGSAIVGASSLGSWGFIVLIAVIFAMTILVSVLGGQQTVTGTSYTPPVITQPPPGGNLPPVPDCSSSDSSLIDAALSSDFGVTLTGNSADCGAKQIAFTTYETLFQSQKYASLVKSAGGTIITMTNDACAGKTSGDDFRIGDCTNHSLPYFYSHEMGHVIENNNPSIETAFNAALPSLISQDKNCYDGQFLKTYLLRTGVIPKHESFAEANALYFLGGRTGIFAPSRGFYGATISDFKSECPATYSYIKDNVFGGFEFNTDSGGSSGGTCTIGTVNTCGGVYSIGNNPTGRNFGDQSCQLVSGGTENKQLVADEIMRQLQSYNKTVDYCRWTCIAHNESGFDPNSYNGNASRPNLGAWGMFQMLPWACYGTDKSYNYNRTGNVDWQEQIRRALQLEYRSLEPNGLSWHYWSTYKHTCHFEPDWRPGISCISNGGH